MEPGNCGLLTLEGVVEFVEEDCDLGEVGGVYCHTAGGGWELGTGFAEVAEGLGGHVADSDAVDVKGKGSWDTCWRIRGLDQFTSGVKVTRQQGMSSPRLALT